MKELFAQEAIAQIPKILTLLDRNPHSPTYGCFDRNYWQYRIIDFPSGMSQEFVWPLALVYSLDIPNNHYYQQIAMADWVEAGIIYAARSSHADGSCDDYFPFERASGAAAFSLLACIESYIILGLENSQIVDFFVKRANWLAHHYESGRLANHEALIVLCLELLSRLLKTDQWESIKAERLTRLLSWQSEEGWFAEYEGFDPGYHTLTISCLGRIYQLYPQDERIKQAIISAVTLASEFIHPDGSYGGEYGSRNTYNFFPHGFELVGKWLPSALQINNQFLVGLQKGLNACYADDHIIGHHTWNYLLAWQDFVDVRPMEKPCLKNDLCLKQAGILVQRRDNTVIYLALNKGGTFKLFRDNQLVVSDTNISLQVRQGKRLVNAVCHLMGSYNISVEKNEILISGEMGWAKQTQMSPFKLILLRVVMLTVGRFFPNLIRKMLQRILITGKKFSPFSFCRQINYIDGIWYVRDQISSKLWQDVVNAGIASDQTSIYVVMSRTFQVSQLQPWYDVTDQISKLKEGETLIINRQF